MWKRLMIYSLLTALINSTVSCSHMAMIRTEESRRPKCQLAITRVELRPIIASLETSDQGEIRFDSAGGRFLPEQGVFVGRVLESDSVRVGLSSVREAQEYRRFPQLNMTSTMPLSRFKQERRDFKAYGVFVDTLNPQGPRLEMADSSGRFSVDGSRFTGLTKDGYKLDIASDDVTASWTSERRISTTRTVLLITGSLVVIAAIVFALAWDPDYSIHFQDPPAPW